LPADSSPSYRRLANVVDLQTTTARCMGVLFPTVLIFWAFKGSGEFRKRNGKSKEMSRKAVTAFMDFLDSEIQHQWEERRKIVKGERGPELAALYKGRANQTEYIKQEFLTQAGLRVQQDRPTTDSLFANLKNLFSRRRTVVENQPKHGSREEARADMTAEERMGTPYDKSDLTPGEDRIVRTEGGMAASESKPTLAQWMKSVEGALAKGEKVPKKVARDFIERGGVIPESRKVDYQDVIDYVKKLGGKADTGPV